MYGRLPLVNNKGTVNFPFIFTFGGLWCLKEYNDGSLILYRGTRPSERTTQIETIASSRRRIVTNID